MSFLRSRFSLLAVAPFVGVLVAGCENVPSWVPAFQDELRDASIGDYFVHYETMTADGHFFNLEALQLRRRSVAPTVRDQVGVKEVYSQFALYQLSETPTGFSAVYNCSSACDEAPKCFVSRCSRTLVSVGEDLGKLDFSQRTRDVTFDVDDTSCSYPMSGAVAGTASADETVTRSCALVFKTYSRNWEADFPQAVDLDVDGQAAVTVPAVSSVPLAGETPRP